MDASALFIARALVCVSAIGAATYMETHGSSGGAFFMFLFALFMAMSLDVKRKDE